MAEQVKAADAPAPALSFGNFADKVASPSGGFNFKAPEFNTGNQGLFGAPTKFGETADKKEGADPRHFLGDAAAAPAPLTAITILMSTQATKKRRRPTPRRRSPPRNLRPSCSWTRWRSKHTRKMKMWISRSALNYLDFPRRCSTRAAAKKSGLKGV